MESNMSNKKVDWQTLAKNLQLALETEIDENDALEAKYEQMAFQVVKYRGVIEYLEKKIGNPKL